MARTPIYPNLPLTNEEFKKLRKKYGIHRNNTYYRVDKLGNPIQFRLTFEEWVTIWYNSGHWRDMGCKTGQYCMSRYNDIGHYEVGNVEIILTIENVVQGIKGMTRPGREGMNKGIKRSPETIERMRASQIGKPQIRGVPLQTPAGVFRNIGDAAAHYGVTTEAIHYFKRKYQEEYYYIK